MIHEPVALAFHELSDEVVGIVFLRRLIYHFIGKVRKEDPKFLRIKPFISNIFQTFSFELRVH